MSAVRPANQGAMQLTNKHAFLALKTTLCFGNKAQSAIQLSLDALLAHIQATSTDARLVLFLA
jgi:hypothetical protein